MITLTDLFCGAGGSSTGAIQIPGVEVVMAANHSRHAIDTHQANHPNTRHDCFAAGTLVLTAAGMRPIEEIQPGELVLTHNGRWRPVVRKFEKRDSTVIAKTALHAAGTEVTANHEFWTRRATLRSAANDYTREYDAPSWSPIGDARIDRVRRAGHSRDMIAFPVSFGELPWIEAPDKLGTDPLAAWWLIGRWLGDGSSGAHNGDVTICCGRHEVDDLRQKVPTHWRGRETSTAYVFYDYDRKLADWLREHFGSGAAGKGIPGWALTMPEDHRRALLVGYLSADGSQRFGLTRASTVSKSLALGIRMLGHSLGYKASLHHSDRGTSCVIEGRTVSRQPVWSVQWRDQPTRQNTMTDELHCWAYVQGVAPGHEDVPVYTMEVAEDHSYVADGLVVKNCADISQVVPGRYPRTDILWASPECFPAGTLILARRGLIPVEDIHEGDEVFTHRRRWRPVVATMHRPADTVIVRGVGLAGGIETTNEHPFYTRKRSKVWDNERRRYGHQLTRTSEWTEARDLEGHAWATPVDFGNQLAVPAVSGRGVELSADLWWMVGRWLGDGSLRIKQGSGTPLPPAARRKSQPAGSLCIVCEKPARPRGNSPTGRVSPYCSNQCKATNKRQNPDRNRHELTIVCGFHEAEELAKRLEAVAPASANVRVTGGELRWQRRDLRTAAAFTTAHRGLVEWLVEHFGQHAYGKTVPAWALTMPPAWRQALLDGYVSADGSIGRTTQFSTVSKRLAIGLRMLANSLGQVANVAGPYTRSGERTIEGRPVMERPYWAISWVTDGPRHAYTIEAEGFRWAPVREVTEGRRTEVYNMTVAEDESYIADGIVVHNCTNHSVAKGKKRDHGEWDDGLFAPDGVSEAEIRSRATMWDVPRFCEEHQYRLVIVENVVDSRWWGPKSRPGAIYESWLYTMKFGLGYAHRAVYMNSMFAAMLGDGAAQSRDRKYDFFWLPGKVEREPDFDKWLRPTALCPMHGPVRAVQAWKTTKMCTPRNPWGRYGKTGQYVWRCPQVACRNAVVTPAVRSAAQIIDWGLPARTIGERAGTKDELAPNTLRRINAGYTKFSRPFLVPNEGREKPPMDILDPLRTVTTRNETGVALPPYVVELRGGGSSHRAITEPLSTVTAGGNHHFLVTAPDMVLPYYGNSIAHPATEPLGTVTTVEGHAAVYGGPVRSVEDCRYRMLEPHEYKAAMHFPAAYILTPTDKRTKVKMLGNAVTPNAARDLVAMAVEALTGQDIERHTQPELAAAA